MRIFHIRIGQIIMAERFAVIDTETNWKNVVMSVGIVIAEDEHFVALDNTYIIIEEAAKVGGMYSYALNIKGKTPQMLDRISAVKVIKDYLNSFGIKSIFAYNASFDARVLPELKEYSWHDILKLAAYKQHNPKIPPEAPCCSTGRLKSGYRVENILHMFGEEGYEEFHNALTDAVDELRIMRYLKYGIEKYPVL